MSKLRTSWTTPRLRPDHGDPQQDTSPKGHWSLHKFCPLSPKNNSGTAIVFGGEGWVRGKFFSEGNISMARRQSEKATQQARDLRKRQTDAESLLWYVLRRRRFCGLKLRRQYPDRAMGR